MRSSVLILGVSLLALPTAAQAHFTILAPPPASNSTNGGKGDPPCGPTDMLSNVVTPVMGGSKLTLKVNETVSHPGFYRVALSIKARSELPVDNVVKDASGMVLLPTSKGMSATAEYQTNPVFPVLADNLFPHTSGSMFSGDITLPNLNCDKCTLQVIEFMANHGSNGDKAGFFYHHCADLKITADSSKPIFDPTASGGAGGGSSGGAGSTAGAGGASGAAVGGAAGTAPEAVGGGAGASGGSPSTSMSGAGGTTGAAVAGAPASGGSSSAGAGTVAGATGTPHSDAGGDSGGCAISNRAAGSKALLSLLLGLLVLGRRRNRRG
jgi:hypothetical protein